MSWKRIFAGSILFASLLLLSFVVAPVSTASAATAPSATGPDARPQSGPVTRFEIQIRTLDDPNIPTVIFATGHIDLVPGKVGTINTAATGRYYASGSLKPSGIVKVLTTGSTTMVTLSKIPGTPTTTFPLTTPWPTDTTSEKYTWKNSFGSGTAEVYAASTNQNLNYHFSGMFTEGPLAYLSFGMNNTDANLAVTVNKFNVIDAGGLTVIAGSRHIFIAVGGRINGSDMQLSFTYNSKVKLLAVTNAPNSGVLFADTAPYSYGTFTATPA